MKNIEQIIEALNEDMKVTADEATKKDIDECYRLRLVEAYGLAVSDIKKVIKEIKLSDEDYAKTTFSLLEIKKGAEIFKKKILELL